MNRANWQEAFAVIFPYKWQFLVKQKQTISMEIIIFRGLSFCQKTGNIHEQKWTKTDNHNLIQGRLWSLAQVISISSLLIM